LDGYPEGLETLTIKGRPAIGRTSTAVYAAPAPNRFKDFWRG
jgi:hypothetical protein